MSKVLHGKELFKEYSSQRIVLKDAELLPKFKGFMGILDLKTKKRK
jgi:hypothetical protein